LELDNYRFWQKRVIEKIVSRLKPAASLCWQVGNHLLREKEEVCFVFCRQ